MTKPDPPDGVYVVDRMFQVEIPFENQPAKSQTPSQNVRRERKRQGECLIEIEPLVVSGDTTLSAALRDICDVLAELHRELHRLRTPKLNESDITANVLRSNVI